MKAGIDCVAVTDHNSGLWVDRVKEAAQSLSNDAHPDFRALTIFPGMEISVNGGTHLLAIFAPDTTTDQLAQLRGAVGYSGTPGESDAVTTRTFDEVVAAIVAAGGIAIPAHVDSEKGLFKELNGQTLLQALNNKHLVAMELCNSSQPLPPQFGSSRANWTRVLGSDSHHPDGLDGTRFPGSHFTWVKMGTPSLEGLRLALLDGAQSIECSDVSSGNPNRRSDLWIKSLTIANARYIGRATPFTVKFSPWLTTFIGGRGSGKSTILELLRLALARDADLPEAFEADFAKYFSTYSKRTDPGLLTKETCITVHYVKDDAEFRITWNSADRKSTMEELDGEGWVPIEGDVAQRFPIRIYSQKEIFHLAKRPRALLQVIDEATEVNGAEWKSGFDELASKYRGLQAHRRELESILEEEKRSKGELEDVNRRIKYLEKAGYTETLGAYEKARRQESDLEEFSTGLRETLAYARKALNDTKVPELGTESFSDDDPIDSRLVSTAKAQAKLVRDLLASQEAALANAEQLSTLALDGLQTEGDWRERTDAAKSAYDNLISTLSGDDTPSGDFANLVSRRKELEGREKKFDRARKGIAEAEEQIEECAKLLDEKRHQLTDRRRTFLEGVLDGNKHVRITLKPYADSEHATHEIRELIHRPERLDSDIGSPGGQGLMSILFPANEPEIDLAKVHAIKRELREIATGDEKSYSSYFTKAIHGLSDEDLDAIELWHPEDSLGLSYCPKGDGKKFQSIESGSPGQMTAALLAFLMSYSRQPLLLDQPEDDLDNQLIYDLIVSHLRDEKRNRQVVVVTHNPNIVVNGDAEKVIALEASSGGTAVRARGSLQSRELRDAVCQIMEGGRSAFDLRYKRIALESTP